MGVHSIKIENYKSIRDSGEIEIKPLNVLIGANGVGKSNFIGFFKLLNRIYDQKLQVYIAQNGRADNFLHFGRKFSSFFGGSIVFTTRYLNEYAFKLVPDSRGNFVFLEEYSNYTHPVSKNKDILQFSTGGNSESKLREMKGSRFGYSRTEFESLRLFHFHDTGIDSKMKQPSVTTDYAYLREDGGNIASFLYRLKESSPINFKIILSTIQSVAPFIDSFFLQPDEINPNQIYLRWKEKNSDQLFDSNSLSDGTLRMICLSTLLLQPKLPETIIIDEPELGLHPFAVSKLAAMLQSASTKSQIIISTQSINLMDHFSPNDILVVERKDNQSVFNRLQENALIKWREEYSLGELWNSNILGGYPK